MILRQFAIGMSLFGIARLYGVFREDVDETELEGWIVYIRNNTALNAVISGILVALMGIVGDWYLFQTLLPAIETGGLRLGYVILTGLFSIGLGLSVGKALTHIDFDVFRNQQTE